jgi:putative Holliday junction resolvase
LKEHKRILAIDYGEKRIGFALSDPLKIFAYPFKTIPNDKNFHIELNKLVEEKNVEKIILGIPSEENSRSSLIADKIRIFKKQIEQTGIEVILWDESYTSAIAKQRIIETVTKKSKRRDKGLLDSNSAAIILQEYLNGA